MKLRDIKGVKNTVKLEFIQAHNPFDDYYEIELAVPKGLEWRAGEHGSFSLPNNKVKGKKFRALSIASTKEEGVIKLGTRTGKDISSFKDELIHMKKGDTVKLRGPFGWFVLKEDHDPVVLIALGVGVTPIRALLVELDKRKDRKVELIYSSMSDYLYKDDIATIIENNKDFTAHFVDTVESTTEAIKNSVDSYSNDANYYISGSVKAIKSVKKSLKEKGIKAKNMINDPFYGY